MTKEQQTILDNLVAIVGGERDLIKENERYEDLEDDYENLKERFKNVCGRENKSIDCGIGKIYYESPDSLQLLQLTEALESAIKKHGPGFVLQVLETIS